MPPKKYCKINNTWKPIEHQWYQGEENLIPISKEFVKKDGQWRLVFEDSDAVLILYNYGYICGGIDPDGTFFPTIDRFTFPLQSGESLEHITDLATQRAWSSGSNSSEHGYIYGGHGGSEGYRSDCERFLFSMDLGHLTDSGILTQECRYMSSLSSSHHGYINGGWRGQNRYTFIHRVDYPFKSGTEASVVGFLQSPRTTTASTNSTNYGYVCGGDVDGHFRSLVERYAFPFQDAETEEMNYLAASARNVASFNSTVHSYVIGGRTMEASESLSYIQRFEFPFDSGSSEMSGDLSDGVYEHCSNNSTIYGYVCGGRRGDGTAYIISTVERLLFSLDTGNSEVVSNLTAKRYAACAVDAIDFTQQFIDPHAYD